MPAARAWLPRAALLCALLCAHGGLPSQAGECKELEQCDKCIEGDASRNITDCVWMHCQESLEKPGTGSCVRKGEPAKEKCLFFNVTKMCEAPQTPTPTTEHSPATTKAPPKPQTKEPEVHTPGSTATPPLTGTPEYRPPGFDSASFIGGIVLVLSLQAVIFFVVKFLRSKDNTYQTLISAGSQPSLPWQPPTLFCSLPSCHAFLSTLRISPPLQPRAAFPMHSSALPAAAGPAVPLSMERHKTLKCSCQPASVSAGAHLIIRLLLKTCLL